MDVKAFRIFEIAMLILWTGLKCASCIVRYMNEEVIQDPALE